MGELDLLNLRPYSPPLYMGTPAQWLFPCGIRRLLCNYRCKFKESSCDVRVNEPDPITLPQSRRKFCLIVELEKWWVVPSPLQSPTTFAHGRSNRNAFRATPGAVNGVRDRVSKTAPTNQSRLNQHSRKSHPCPFIPLVIISPTMVPITGAQRCCDRQLIPPHIFTVFHAVTPLLGAE